MKGYALRSLLWFALFACGTSGAGAQDESETRSEFWPEISVYLHPSHRFRLFFLGTVSRVREGAKIFGEEPYEGYIGAHLDFIPNKNVILRTGYRFGTSLNGSDPFKEHRIIGEQTFRRLLPGNLRLSDRNRQDFRIVDGDYSFRYRNRLTLEREFVFRERAITPYTSGELYFDSRFNTWNRNRYAFGTQIHLKPAGPLRDLLPKRQVILDLYYMRQNDSRSSSPHVNVIGMIWSIYY
jgi:Protein of unknown function (DUF2490)